MEQDQKKGRPKLAKSGQNFWSDNQDQHTRNATNGTKRNTGVKPDKKVDNKNNKQNHNDKTQEGVGKRYLQTNVLKQ